MIDSEEVESQVSLLLRTVLGAVLHVLGTLGVAAGFQDGVSPGVLTASAHRALSPLSPLHSGTAPAILDDGWGACHTHSAA